MDDLSVGGGGGIQGRTTGAAWGATFCGAVGAAGEETGADVGKVKPPACRQTQHQLRVGTFVVTVGPVSKPATYY